MTDQEQLTQLEKRTVRSVYLITYSQANLEKLPTWEKFAECIVQVFESTGNNKVEKCVCSQERHADNGKHYHMAIKLKKS